MQTQEIAQLIEAGLPGARALVQSDDGVHFGAAVIAPQFEGKRARDRHRLVYATLGERVGGEIHALSLQTYTPAEWDERERR